jgi:glycerate kinase
MKEEGPGRSRGTLAFGEHPRFGQPASGRLRHPLSAARAAAAIGRGVQAADPSLGVDLCPMEPVAGEGEPASPPQAPHDFDRRMRAARAVVVGGARLDERTLLGSPTFELATRARQAGVPTYAVTAGNGLSPFDARILDLQVILQARDARALRRAGEKLAALM